MKYDRSKIFTRAWALHNRFNMTFALALRRAWGEAKEVHQHYTVIGYRIHDGSTTIIRTGITREQTGEVEYRNKCAYDRIEVRAA